MRTKSKFSYGVLAIMTLALLCAAPSEAVTKTGTKCAKKGLISNSGGKTYTCLKIGNFLIWSPGYSINKPIPSTSTPSKPTSSPKPTPTPTLGSISMPVPASSPLKIGTLTYTIDKVLFNVDSAVCAGNGLNSGCKLDDNFNAVVDPTSTTSWVAVNFTVQNSGADIANPAGFLTGFNLVLSNGQLLENQDFVVGYPRLSDVRIIPGGSGSGAVMVQVPKSVTSLKSFLVIRDSSHGFSTNDYYFQISW